MKELYRKIKKELCSLPYLLWVKITHWNSFKFHILQEFHNSSRMVFNPGKIKLHKCVHIRRNVELNASGQGMIDIGCNVCINNNCQISSRKNIIIGDRTEIGPGVVIIDHDHDFKATKGIQEQIYKAEEILIGKDVWIGANSIILRGSIIGDGAVIAGGSIVNSKVPSNSIYIQKRNKEITTYRRVGNIK